MKTETIETWLPVFSGFYYTIWDDIDETCIQYDLEHESEFREIYPELEKLPWNFIEENFRDCVQWGVGQVNIVKGICDEMPDFLNEIVPGLVNSCQYQEIRRPREYNFTNDAVNVAFDINLTVLRKFIYEHVNQLEDYLQKRYTSRDGFFSYYPNTIVDWEDETQNFLQLGGHYLGSLLQFIAETEHGNESDWKLYEHCENLVSDYCPDIDTGVILHAWNKKEAA